MNKIHIQDSHNICVHLAGDFVLKSPVCEDITILDMIKRAKLGNPLLNTHTLGNNIHKSEIYQFRTVQQHSSKPSNPSIYISLPM